MFIQGYNKTLVIVEILMKHTMIKQHQIFKLLAFALLKVYEGFVKFLDTYLTHVQQFEKLTNFHSLLCSL